jgi:Secretion system C-terminal sorting domain
LSRKKEREIKKRLNFTIANKRNYVKNMKRNQTTYYSTSTVTDLFTDAYYLQLALEAATEGIVDSNIVIENFENSIVYQVYNLENALASEDSTLIATAAIDLPRNDVGDNYIFVAGLLASSQFWTASDSIKIWDIAWQRVDDGGSAVIIARNMLGIYVDDNKLVPKNKKGTLKNGGIYLTIFPNPNIGSFIITTNIVLPSQIEIFNSTGTILHRSSLNNYNQQVDLKSLSNGMYYCKILDQTGKSKTISFVINK